MEKNSDFRNCHIQNLVSLDGSSESLPSDENCIPNSTHSYNSSISLCSQSPVSRTLLNDSSCHLTKLEQQLEKYFSSSSSSSISDLLNNLKTCEITLSDSQSFIQANEESNPGKKRSLSLLPKVRKCRKNPDRESREESDEESCEESSEESCEESEFRKEVLENKKAAESSTFVSLNAPSQPKVWKNRKIIESSPKFISSNSSSQNELGAKYDIVQKFTNRRVNKSYFARAPVFQQPDLCPQNSHTINVCNSYAYQQVPLCPLQKNLAHLDQPSLYPYGFQWPAQDFHQPRLPYGFDQPLLSYGFNQPLPIYGYRQPLPPDGYRQTHPPHHNSQQPHPPHNNSQEPHPPHNNSQEPHPSHGSQQPVPSFGFVQPLAPYGFDQPLSSYGFDQPLAPYPFDQPLPLYEFDQPLRFYGSQQPLPPHGSQQPLSSKVSWNPLPPHRSQGTSSTP